MRPCSDLIFRVNLPNHTPRTAAMHRDRGVFKRKRVVRGGAEQIVPQPCPLRVVSAREQVRTTTPACRRDVRRAQVMATRGMAYARVSRRNVSRSYRPTSAPQHCLLSYDRCRNCMGRFPHTLASCQSRTSAPECPSEPHDARTRSHSMTRKHHALAQQ